LEKKKTNRTKHERGRGGRGEKKGRQRRYQKGNLKGPPSCGNRVGGKRHGSYERMLTTPAKGEEKSQRKIFFIEVEKNRRERRISQWRNERRLNPDKGGGGKKKKTRKLIERIMQEKADPRKRGNGGRTARGLTGRISMKVEMKKRREAEGRLDRFRVFRHQVT